MKSWTDEELRKAVAGNNNITDVLCCLGLGSSGAAFRNIKKHFERLDLDTKHFKPKRKGPTPKSIQEISGMTRLNSSSEFKKRLLREGLLLNQCSLCGLLPEWEGRPLTLQLDHIDGNTGNNQLSNLRILCPNCHTQTDTFSSLNRAKPKKSCVDCGTLIQRKSTRCPECLTKKRNQESKSIKKISSNGRVRYYKSGAVSGT